MSLHRFYLPPGQCAGDRLVLTGPEAHHALCVLRLRPAERVTALDGAGGEFRCEVTACARDSVALAVLERLSQPAPYCQVTLFQALPKGKIIEDIIQKATELGVARIVPLLTERATMRLDHRTAAAKAQKWRLVAIEAIKQCGSAWLPQIETPLPLSQFLARGEKFEMALVASLQAGGRHPRDCFREFAAKHGRQPRTACVWVGPEGDFTPDELDAIRASGALPISLGRLVLRVETAAICCVSFLNYELQSAAP